MARDGAELSKAEHTKAMCQKSIVVFLYDIFVSEMNNLKIIKKIIPFAIA